MTYPFGQRMGSYRLIRLLGRGGSAQVYLGQHVHIQDRQAAIKVLSEHYTDAELQRFRNEASTIFRLEHPHIVRVLDFGIEGRTPFLVMSYAPHGTLRQRHPAGRRVPLEAILSYVKQVAEALQYAHEERVVHRDIKPENLLIGSRQQILLSDFGLAIRAHSPDSQTPQWVSGTAYYMAPEQCRGNACQESDQYSLTVVVYEWLCGAPPFPGENPFSIVLQHIETPPPPLRPRVPTLSPMVEQVVMKALAKDPRNRFPSVRAFAAALEEAIQAPPQDKFFLTNPALPSVPPGPPPGPHPLLADAPPSVPLPVPAEPSVQRALPAGQRRERPVLERNTLPFFIGGGFTMLIGILALIVGNWTIALFAFGIGSTICIAAFLL